MKIELPYDRAKELKVVSQRDVCSPMIIAALFRIAKGWKQPKCPLTDEWIYVVNTYPGILFSL